MIVLHKEAKNNTLLKTVLFYTRKPKTIHFENYVFFTQGSQRQYTFENCVVLHKEAKNNALTIDTYTIRSHYTLTIYTYTIHLYYTLTLYTDTIHLHIHLRYTLRIQTYTIHLHYTLTIYTMHIR